jgi:hypothetical protein
MKIPLKILQKLRSSYNIKINLNCVYFEDFAVSGKKFKTGDDVSIADMEYFQKNNYGTISVFFNERFYNMLANEFPVEYRRPYGTMDFIGMDRRLDALNTINGQTKRKRFLYVVGDIYGVDGVTGKRSVLVTNGEILEYKRWNESKRFVIKEQKFYYRNCETAVIIFINMKADVEGNFVERFRKNTDLVTSLVTRKKDSRVAIAPDFIPTEDVISVTDPEKLLDVYKESFARLVIIGENINETYKRSLLQLKQYDKFARMMVVPSIDPRDIEHFLMQVKLVYNSDRWAV